MAGGVGEDSEAIAGVLVDGSLVLTMSSWAELDSLVCQGYFRPDSVETLPPRGWGLIRFRKQLTATPHVA